MADTKPYRVVDQQPDTAIGNTGQVERGYRVYFIPLGMTQPFDVFIPASSYTAENADALIMHEVAKIQAVQALGS